MTPKPTLGCSRSTALSVCSHPFPSSPLAHLLQLAVHVLHDEIQSHEILPT